MKMAIIINGWDQRPDQEWLPWLAEELSKKGWAVELPAMPNSQMPKLEEWMDKLIALVPNANTVLIGHSLANALILKYMERKDILLKATFLVAAWDYQLPDLLEEHGTFFKEGFDYQAIKAKNIPITIFQSTNDPYLDFSKGKQLAKKIGATFIAVENAGHFGEKSGYKQFPDLLKLVERL